MIYLASPYTAKTKEEMEENYQRVLNLTGKIISKRHNVWSPIVHTHLLALQFDLPKDFEFWKNYNHDFIRRCDALWVVCLPGWKDSKGVADEISFAKTIGIPVVLIDEDTNLLTENDLNDPFYF
jgi:hypothetical protein